MLTPTFRYNPAVRAQTFATLGMLYPGRVFHGPGDDQERFLDQFAEDALPRLRAVGSSPSAPPPSTP